MLTGLDFHHIHNVFFLQACPVSTLIFSVQLSRSQERCRKIVSSTIFFIFNHKPVGFKCQQIKVYFFFIFSLTIRQ